MNLSQAAGASMLDAWKALHNGGSLVIYSGAMPASPETALSGNTALVTLTLSATAFGSDSAAGAYEQASASFTATSYSPTASGLATWARVLESNGTTAIEDVTVIAPYAASPTFTPPVGFLVTNGGNTYKATAVTGATAGTAPTGTTTSTDGGVTWTYVGAGTLGDVVISAALVQLGVAFSSPTMTLKVPVV